MSSATNKKTNKKQSATPVDIELNDTMDQHQKDLCKKIRNSRKKMLQIQDLVKRSKEGEIVLNDEQKDKVGGKKALAEELAASENQLEVYRETLKGESKKAKELEQKRQKELKQCRETTISQFADVLVLANLKQRGVDLGDSGFTAGIGALGDAYNALIAEGDSVKAKEKETFVKLFSSFVNSSTAKVPGTDTTYLSLNEGVPALFESGNLPATIPSAKAEEKPAAAQEAPAKVKKVKPSPAEFGHIAKAVDDKVVAEEDKQEETVAVEMDDDFLGVFDDEDDDAQPAPAKEEPKPQAETQAPANEGEAEGETQKPQREKKKWEDGDNKGQGNRGDRRGRGDRGNRGRGGRGGRGRGYNPNQDEEGFTTVTDQPKERGRGRGGRGRGRGDRGSRGDRGDRGGRGGRPDTAGVGMEHAGGKEAGTRGGRPQSSRINASEAKPEE